MPTLLNTTPQRQDRPKTDNCLEYIAIDTHISLSSRHLCPCCSYLLLRHIRRGGIYWRCNHCYQEMPIL